MRSILLTLALMLVGLSTCFAQAGTIYEVIRPVRLTTASGQRITTLHPGAQVVATGGKNGDYIRVRDEEEQPGWVYAPYLSEVESEPEEPTTAPQATSTSTGATTTAGLATSVDPNWDKPEPQTQPFTINGLTCEANGTPGGDTETNRRKNRIDLPASYHAITFGAVDHLGFPTNATTKRTTWTAAQLQSIAPFEGVALTVTGYLVAVRPQKGNHEACNCGMSGADETDWHLALAEHPNDSEGDAMVVETTPRIRVNHPNWTESAMTEVMNSQMQIRVSGWLLMDPVHKGHLHVDSQGHGPYRNTLWEIHPITRIEVLKNGAWVDLDSGQFNPS